MKTLEKRFIKLFDKYGVLTRRHFVDENGETQPIVSFDEIVIEDRWGFTKELLKAVEDYGEEVKAKTELDYVKVYYPKEVPMEVRNPIFMYLDKFLLNLRNQKVMKKEKLKMKEFKKLVEEYEHYINSKLGGFVTVEEQYNQIQEMSKVGMLLRELIVFANTKLK